VLFRSSLNRIPHSLFALGFLAPVGRQFGKHLITRSHHVHLPISKHEQLVDSGYRRSDLLQLFHVDDKTVDSAVR